MKSFILVVLLYLLSWTIALPALALTEIKLSDISYHECPDEIGQGAVTSGGTARPANCFIVTGKANNSSGKIVYDADVFGRIYDANDNPVMQNRTRVGTIDQIPPGITDFEIRISVADNQPTPLRLAQFKARGFTAQIRH